MRTPKSVCPSSKGHGPHLRHFRQKSSSGSEAVFGIRYDVTLLDGHCRPSKLSSVIVLIKCAISFHLWHPIMVTISWRDRRVSYWTFFLYFGSLIIFLIFFSEKSDSLGDSNSSTRARRQNRFLEVNYWFTPTTSSMNGLGRTRRLSWNGLCWTSRSQGHCHLAYDSYSLLFLRDIKIYSSLCFHAKRVKVKVSLFLKKKKKRSVLEF